MQHKLLQLSASEIKFSGDNPRVFSGYASVFNGVDAYGDSIEPGAYKETINPENRDRPIQLRWNHFGPVIGKWKAMAEDEKGLWVEGELTPNHSVASDVAASLAHGAVNGLSIGYRVAEDGVEMRGNTRVLKKIDLFEISVVEEPADNMARVSGIKSMLEEVTTLKEIEAILRDAGRFSKADATALVSRVKSLSLGDQVGEQDTSDLKALLQRNINLIKGG